MSEIEWEIVPDKVQYFQNEPVTLQVYITKGKISDGHMLRVTVYHRQHAVWSQEKKMQDGMEFHFRMTGRENGLTGWLVRAELLEGGEQISVRYTAFDQADFWYRSPRYGFLSDFAGKDREENEDVEFIRRMHLNVVQFYDWMYRHDDYFPKKADFSDIMGKKGSMDTVREKIDRLHGIGSRAFAYGAVYGAESFQTKNPECQYCHEDGSPMMFIDKIALMDIHRDSQWHDHILEEYQKAIDWGFDGIHMDQYGEPKEALVKKENGMQLRCLEKDFENLIEDARQKMPQAGFIFNAVNNWPMESVAHSSQDCIYIEVWAPHDTYRDLYRLVKTAKAYEPQKQVILAAYLYPFYADCEAAQKGCTAQLAMATICASGGFHLLLGEERGILTQAYYSDYRKMDDRTFCETMKSYYDFITAYGELLFSEAWRDVTDAYTGGINTEICFLGAACGVEPEKDRVWTQVKRGSEGFVIQLVNYMGVESDQWNELHADQPKPVKNLTVTVKIPGKIEGIWMASPDQENGRMKALNYRTDYDLQKDRIITFTVPEVKIWNLIYICRVDETL